MKFLGIALALGVQPFGHLTCAQVTGGGGPPPAVRASTSRFAEDDVSNVGIVAVHAIAPGDEQIAEEVIENFEADGQTTGETFCPPYPC